jgi:hypothetical protein
MKIDRKYWALLFFAAGVFNFCLGGPIFFAPGWSYRLAYIGEADAATLRFWSDFGFAVLLIGVGYFIVAVNVDKGIGIVWLGILAKLFDVIVLTLRFSDGLANVIVLLPAAIDGAFVLAFALFLWSKHSGSSNESRG